MARLRPWPLQNFWSLAGLPARSLTQSRSLAGFRGFSPLQVARGIDLVYGGGSVGLMGLIAQTVLDGGCSVLGYLLSWIILLLFSSSALANFMFELFNLSNVWLLCLIRLQGDSKSTHAA
jgi:hypothetical protein